ncbi:MFS transporter [Microbacterium hydrocarbonoxydans]|uniref:MFS transporter n=1 Tax=Microbacterium hydrocarbonoxydans TaxID=273678 RepID=UPI0007BBD173|nr:MFS transporter [Microbacterium hydrocarbonoxydans]GAT72458.1 major facilitator superfamily MFS_1 [Microbacterium sp. HM58-2]
MSSLLSRAGTPESAERVYRKIFFRIIPFLMLLWIVAWIDRVNIGFVKLRMLEDLQWSETIYGIGAGIFFIGYFLFEVPSNLLLQKIGARKTIMRITIGWGTVSVLMMFATTPEMFYVLRFLLGVFEAGFYPGIILYLTYWFPGNRRAKAFGMFMSASAFAGVIGGPIAGLIMNTMGGVAGLAEWQWVFIIEGIPSIILGIITFFFLTDRPRDAKWLTPSEREFVQSELDLEEKTEKRPHGMLDALKGKTIWLFILIFFCIIAANSSLTFYGPTLVSNVGFSDPLIVGWIMAGISLLGAIGMIVGGFISDRTGESRIQTAVSAGIGAVGLAGAAIMINISPLGAILCLAMALVGTMSAIPIFWQMPNRFLAGAAAAGGVALINSIANLAGFGAPFMLGSLKDQTGSLAPGLLIVSAVEICATILILLLVPKFKEVAKTTTITVPVVETEAEVAPVAVKEPQA